MTILNDFNFRNLTISGCLILLFLQPCYSQFEYMGKIPNEKRGDFYNTHKTSVVKTSSSLYYLSRNSNRELYVLKEGKAISELVKDFGPNRIYHRTYGYNDNLYFATRRTGSGNQNLKIYKCNENNVLTELWSHTVNEHLSTFNEHGKYLFYSTNSNDKNLFYRYDRDLEVLDTIHQNSKELRLLGVYEEGMFFFESLTHQQADLCFMDHNGNKTVLFHGHFMESLPTWSKSGIISTSDSLNWYVKVKKNDGSYTILRIEKNTFQVSEISNLDILEIHPRGINKYDVLLNGSNSPFFIAQMNNDTLDLDHKIVLKNNQLTTNYSYNLESAKSRFYSIIDNEYGIELGVVNQEDSVERILDLNKGKFSSVPFRNCSVGGHPSSSAALFDYNEKTYAFLSNGNDNDVYLYEVKEDTLISLSKAPGFNSSRVRIVPFDEYIYYISMNSLTEESHVYRWKWDDPLEFQPEERDFNSTTWYTELGMNRENRPCPGYANNLRSQNVIIDELGSVYTSFINNEYGGLPTGNLVYDLANKTYIPTMLTDIYAKYNDFGELQWLRGIGSRNKFFDSYDQFTIDKSGNVNIFGVFHHTGYFDEDTLEVLGTHRYWAKLDSETGKILAVKPLYKTDYVDDPEFFRVKSDKEDHFYVSGKYVDFELDLNDTILISDWSHQSFIAKYDQEGTVIWARNVLTNWNDFIGDIRNIELNHDTREIIVFCSQNLTYWCDDDKWGGVLIVYDFDGKEKQRLVISGNNQHHNGLATQLDGGRILVKGLIRGAIRSDIFEYQNAIDDNCFEISEYTFVFDQKQNRVMRANVTIDNNGIIPMVVREDGTYKYFMGSDFDSRKVVIQRYDLKGNYKGKKIINQLANRVNFDVKNDFFILTGPNFVADKDYPVADIWRYSDVFSILKFKIEDWDLTPQDTRPMDVINIDNDLGLNVYPNPFTSTFEINFQDIDFEFEQYKISNSIGQIIKQGKVFDQNFMKFDLSENKNGVYYITLFGKNEQKTAKLIKL